MVVSFLAPGFYQITALLVIDQPFVLNVSRQENLFVCNISDIRKAQIKFRLLS